MKDTSFEDYILAYKVEEIFEYRKWMFEIPFMQFPKEWFVRITPPFAGAVVRFYASLTDGGDGVSVYLDCYDRLGFMQQPYWEAYPIEGDTARFYLKETKELIEAIDNELRRRENGEQKEDNEKGSEGPAKESTDG